MSRIGKKPIAIPAGVTVTVDENNFALRAFIRSAEICTIGKWRKKEMVFIKQFYIHTFSRLKILISSNSLSAIDIETFIKDLSSFLMSFIIQLLRLKIILQIKVIEKVNTYFNGRLSITTKLLKGDTNLVSRERVNDFRAWLDS